MENVTYLLGAGASANALPVVKNFPDALNNIKSRISSILYEMNRGKKYREDQKKIYEIAGRDLQELYEGCVNHASVDTYAKMLFLTNRNKRYRKTKCEIILFFELYRYFNKTFDKRYDAFLASILSKTAPRFPSNIKVISWNYDYEFEKAYLKYSSNSRNIEDVYNELNVLHKNNNVLLKELNNFGILKINGVAGVASDDRNVKLGFNNTNLYVEENENDFERLFPIVEKYYNIAYSLSEYSNYDPVISFAWDDDLGTLKMRDEVKDILTDTKILVIIGYSFPYFNREMDRYIMQCLKSKGGSKVYIQNIDADNVIENIRGLKSNWSGIEFNTIKNVEQFFMPHEL